MEIKIPTMRNKNVGYGQGSTLTPISDEFAEYAPNLVATNIVLLVGRCGRRKKKDSKRFENVNNRI